jgi:hypothetical protein
MHLHNIRGPYRIEKPKLKVKGKSNDWKQKKSKGAVKSDNAAIGPLKRRLRDLNRLLSKNSNLPADIRIGHEREIQALQHELTNLLLEKEKHEMIGKYHMVRFFERQRATRQLKKATKALEACEDDEERSRLESRAYIAEVDFNYTQYYPHMTVYQSLWTKEKGEDEEWKYKDNGRQQDGAKGNVAMWRGVEKASQNGTLEKLRDSVDEEKVERIRKSIATMGTAPGAEVKAKNRQAVDADGDDEEDETGVGFFE